MVLQRVVFVVAYAPTQDKVATGRETWIRLYFCKAEGIGECRFVILEAGLKLVRD